ncbi:hypothetical protein AB0M11_25385 [Streptomyces sp. NPDC051987]|uniref:hypothetical protein n=1 Tax=Streptomyces sp. NPDC051987 TaxID=3155808 RepID=UPI00343F8536
MRKRLRTASVGALSVLALATLSPARQAFIDWPNSESAFGSAKSVNLAIDWPNQGGTPVTASADTPAIDWP